MPIAASLGIIAGILARGGVTRTVVTPAMASAPAADAAIKDDDVKKSAALIFKSNPTCLVGPTHYPIPASPVFPNPDDYTTLATLRLPEGEYLVTGKMSAFAANRVSSIRVLKVGSVTVQ